MMRPYICDPDKNVLCDHLGCCKKWCHRTFSKHYRARGPKFIKYGLLYLLDYVKFKLRRLKSWVLK